MSKKPKDTYVDDGHTIYDMDGVGSPFQKISKKSESLGMTKKERRAAIKAAFIAYLPMFLCALACFAVAILLIYLWLK